MLWPEKSHKGKLGERASIPEDSNIHLNNNWGVMMKMYRFMHADKRLMLSLIVFFVVAFMPILSAQDLDEVEIKATQVRGNIYMLEGSGGNIGVSIGDDGILMIDDQFAPLAQKIEKTLSELDGGQLRFLLNTHWHGDHTGGNEFFGKSATIIAHENVRTRLTTDQTSRGRVVPAKSKDGWPVITHSQSMSIYFNGEEIEVIHYPHGHTDGDIVIFFTNSNVVHMGDDFFAGLFPYVDLDHGGDVKTLIETIGSIIARLPVDVKIIPGHGPLSTLDDLRKYHRMLKTTSDMVHQQMQDGKTLEQITQQGLPAEWGEWSWNFISTERWIETIYQSFSKE